MPDEKHEPNRNGHFRQKLFSAAAILLLVLLAVSFGIQYLSFVSQTIYQESTSHLEEVLHKSNNMLKEMVRKNVSAPVQQLSGKHLGHGRNSGVYRESAAGHRICRLLLPFL